MTVKAMLVAPAAVLALAFSALPAAAHSAPPCNDSGDPGHSDYAKHHIVALAHDGALGNDGHKPGTHRGYSLCLDIHG